MLPPQVISLPKAFEQLTFLEGRRPNTPSEDMTQCFAQLSGYRDGAITIGHYAGNSEWESHPQGDEVVMVIEGETTVFLWEDAQEVAHRLGAMDLIVVPQGQWHRFETPKGVKILTVTPQPTEHRQTPP